jgi:hypothetical protein
MCEVLVKGTGIGRKSTFVKTLTRVRTGRSDGNSRAKKKIKNKKKGGEVEGSWWRR